MHAKLLCAVGVPPADDGADFGAADGEAAAGSGHGDVEQAARRVGVLALGSLVPASVQDDDVVELQPLRPMRGRQQQAALVASGILRPFREPLAGT